MSLVITGLWPDSNEVLTRALIEDIICSFKRMVGVDAFPNLMIMNDPNREGPMVKYEPVAGNKLILLSSSSGTLWSKIGYQLSHELCHVHANHADQRGHRFKWLEESFCELASLCNLLQMGESWQTAPPLEHMRTFAPNHVTYVENTLNAIQIPDNFEFWLQDNLDELMSSPYLREKNSIVGAKLKPLFTNDIKIWKAIGYLNCWEVGSLDSLTKYLTDWKDNCPEELQDSVVKLSNILGVSIA